MPPIGSERLVLAMKMAGLSPKQLAKAAGVSVDYVHDLLSGRRGAERNGELRGRVADALGVPRDWIELSPEQAKRRSLRPPRARAPRRSADALADILGESKKEIARRLGIDASALSRPLTAMQAERYAKKLGLNPQGIWPVTPSTAKFDPEPLIAYTGDPLRAVARRLGVDPAVLCRPLTARQADRFANKLGVHPTEVWGARWWRDPTTVSSNLPTKGDAR